MRTAFVDRLGDRFIVKTGIPIPGGYIRVKKLDIFSNLSRANKKARLVNYINKKISEYCQKARG